MANKFNLADLMPKGEVSKTDTMQVREIDLQLIDSNEMNFYDVSNVEDLMESIQLIGLQQPLVLRANGERYTLIAGHRRFAALVKLDYKTAPCTVTEPQDTTREELALIFTNSTSRNMTWQEKNEQSKRVENCLLKLKDEGVELPGKMRAHVAELMKISEAELGRMKAIDNNLSDEWKQKLIDKKISASTAYEISKMDENIQERLFEKYKNVEFPGSWELLHSAKRLANPWALEKCPTLTYTAACSNFEEMAPLRQEGVCDRDCCFGCDKLCDCHGACGHAINAKTREGRAAEMAAEGKAAREAFEQTPLGECSLRIKIIRKKLDLTQEDLAERLKDVTGCNYAALDVDDWETCSDATDMPDCEDIINLAKLFDCTTDYLFGVSSQRKGSRFCTQCEFVPGLNKKA